MSVKSPLEWLSVVRMEVHDHIRQLSISVEDQLRRILGNIKKPVKRL